jgi:hypothetical protein
MVHTLWRRGKAQIEIGQRANRDRFERWPNMVAAEIRNGLFGRAS